MLSIGEFSNICQASTKTLRYYDEIGLLKPSEINPENGYRYYAIDQLERMLFINRLKSYSFSLEEIKEFLAADEKQDEILRQTLARKKKELEEEMKSVSLILGQLDNDIQTIEQGKSVMSCMIDM